MKDKILRFITIRNINLLLSITIIILLFTAPLLVVVYDGYAIANFKLQNMSLNLAILKEFPNYKFDGNIMFLSLAIIPFVMGLFSIIIKDESDVTSEYLSIGGSLLSMFIITMSLSWMRKNESLSNLSIFQSYQISFGKGVLWIFIIYIIIIGINFFSFKKKR